MATHAHMLMYWAGYCVHYTLYKINGLGAQILLSKIASVQCIYSYRTIGIELELDVWVCACVCACGHAL